MSDAPTGESGRFAELYRTTLAPLRRYLARLLGNAAEAQDVAHDAYLRVYPTAGRAVAERPEAVLYVTARRLAINRLKRRSISPVATSPFSPETAASAAPDVADQVMARQELALLERAIADLPEGCRTVLLLRKVELLSHREIADRLDGAFARTTVNRGYNVFAGNLRLKAASPYNPFGQEVEVALNETAPRLGEGYSAARLEFGSDVFGALIRLPAGWRVSGDAQYARNVTRYRGLLRADPARWQDLVDTGAYNPLRDTQVFAPPPEFYDRVLVFRARRGEFATLGDYDTVDAALRVTNETLAPPTGRGILNFGGDYRRNHMQPYFEQPHFGDGSPAGEPFVWRARTIQRYSAFAELQASLLSERLRPTWLRAAEADLAVRHVAANSAREDYVSPTLGLKFEFPGGLTARGSFTSSNRFPTPQMSRPVALAGAGGPGSPDLTTIYDPRRDEVYETAAALDESPGLATEAALTQTFGLVLQRGKVHRLRAALDYVDTRKTNELIAINTQNALDLEAYLPGRVVRDPVSPDDPSAAGRVNFILEGAANLGHRSSRNWNLSLDYVWREAAGGSLSLYSRLIYYERYRRQIVPGAEDVDELRRPQFGDISLLRYRSNFGASWTASAVGFGVDGHYFHSRVLPRNQWAGQGHDRIRPLWQFDTFIQGNLDRWLPRRGARFGLSAQLRVNNVFGADYPKYFYAPAGVQSYGDWRGRVVSLSLTTTF